MRVSSFTLREFLAKAGDRSQSHLDLVTSRCGGPIPPRIRRVVVSMAGSQQVHAMTLAQQYDAIVIGSGQGGTPLSLALAQAGMHTILIERKHVGGTCINEGCTPTKT